MTVERGCVVVAQDLLDELLRAHAALLAVQVHLFGGKCALDAGADPLLGLAQRVRHGAATSFATDVDHSGSGRRSLRSRGAATAAGRKSWSSSRATARA